MAVDKLVDSTQLDTDLTSVANAIRTKGGTSAQLAFPAGFVQAIADIPTGGGGGNAWASDIAKMTISFARGTLPPGNLILDFPNATIGIGTFLLSTAGGSDNTEITINAYRIVGSTINSAIAEGVNNICQNATKITKLTLNSVVNPVTGSQFLYGGSIQRVLGTPIVCTALGTSSNRRFNSTNLVEFYLVPNKITDGGAGINTGVLVDATLVSVANALSGTATGQTLTISNAATKAKCNTIVGTVSQVTESGETYDFFTQNASGTVTLADFITNTKGWTLA